MSETYDGHENGHDKLREKRRPSEPGQAGYCLVPQVRVAIDAAAQKLWGGRALTAHLGDLERLLMVNADCPAIFDIFPSSDVQSRNIILVNAVSKSFKANPSALGPVVKRVGASLMHDRVERGGIQAGGAVQPNVELITRTVACETSKSSWRHNN